MAAKLEALGGRAISAACDVSQTADVESLRDAAVNAFHRVDIVMSNVGVLAVGLPEDIPLEEWQRIIDINLLGTVRVLAAFVPLLIEQRSGHIVTTASTAGLFPYAFDRLPYAATKAGVVALTEGLALYLRPNGIGVTCLCPAGVMTNIVEQMRFFGPPRPVQAPQIPMVTAEEVGELVADAIEADTLLVVTHPESETMMRRHADDPEAFLQAQLAWLTGSTD